MKLFNKLVKWIKNEPDPVIEIGFPILETEPGKFGTETGQGLKYMPVPFCSAQIAVLPAVARNSLKGILGYMENKSHTVEFLLFLIKKGSKHRFQVFIKTSDSHVILHISSSTFCENGIFRSQSVDFAHYQESPFLQNFLNNL